MNLKPFSRHIRRALVLLAASAAMAQGPAPKAATAQPSRIVGTIKAGNILLPGVAVSAANTLTGKKVVTSSNVNGEFALVISAKGRWVVRAELAAFAPITKEMVFNAENAGTTQRADLEMVLASRQQQLQQQQSQQTQQAAAAANPAAAAGRGFQNLTLNESEAGNDAEAAAMSNNAGSSDAIAASMPTAAMGGNASSESVSVTGNMGRTENFSFDENELRQRVDDAMRNGGGNFQLGGNQPGGPGGGGPGQIMIGGGGGGGRGGGRGGRGVDINKPHGQLFYNFGNSALDARPYSLTGIAAMKPDYSSSRYGFFVGGPLKIPHIYDGGTKTMYYINYFGLTASNPFDVFATVPTALERAGDFSQTRVRSGPNAGSLVTIYDPVTHLPYPGNVVPLSAAAAGLLQYYPLPNQPGTSQNYHAISSSDSGSHNINSRLNHNFGETTRRTPGARGGRGGGSPFGSRHSITAAFSYRISNSQAPNFSPLLGGTTHSSGYNLNLSYVRPVRGVTTRTGFVLNHNHTESAGLYANLTNVEGGLGITGVSTNPFDYGVPTLSFSNYSSLRDVTPQLRNDDSWQITESASWNHKKHNVRFGGDFRRSSQDLRSNSNPRGSFIFTGFATTTAGGTPTTGTGYDLADFLLGLPQQTSAQYSQNTYRFTGNGYNFFVQDDWRARAKLTLNLGLRYEYISPLAESSNQLVNLDVAPGFTAVAPVQPGQAGPYNGVFPRTLVNPDRNNFAPRIGVAWSPRKKTVVRAGYGVNYNLGQYGAIVQQLAFQPPFAFTETNIANTPGALTLQNGFPAQAGVTNSYAIDRNYRLGYTQTWNLDVQQELRGGVVMNLDYTGTKGTRLDLQRAPNRGPSGLRIPGVQAFIFESSDADSILHAGSIRMRKRMQRGFSVGGSYTFSKSIDNASSIGGGGVVVAQNDLDLAAERGLSSFDQRHRLTADFNLELPWGTNKHWLNNEGWAAKTFGDWSLNGTLAASSGIPYTARVLNDIADIARGTNGTLRANYNGQPIGVADPTLLAWFNTAAFSIPTTGTFGDSGRNIIIGPGSVTFNTSMTKTVPIKDTKSFVIRATATNLFNHANYSSIDTAVNSPTFGRVLSVGSMRKFQIQTQFRF